MTKVKKKRKSPNQDLYKIVKKYFIISSFHEKMYDLVLPFVLSAASFLLIYFSKIDLLKITSDLNNVILTILSILAGFNTASLAVISSSNQAKVIDKLSREDKTEGEDLLDGLTSYFSYAILL
ncbi:hypothetical protein [Heyndrickxia ginsengihumi]|uniref:hypothetical protein n=1 Tax=Heyndrickxia ginsengihumi TaxID=363870 RepID=UPI00203C1DE8|nr:hypothetical protein [Heyndrickxia ginsengihumi]MCM3022577.1 hypothetical protein [Heyndrickxia ginsengihumi]